MAYEIQVTCMGYDPDEGYYISLKTDKFYFCIEEPYCYTDKEIDSMIERKEECGIVGGGNSLWSLCIKDGSFQLEYEISGMGTGSTFSCALDNDKPILEILELIKKINKLNEENKKYVSSSDHIKVSDF